MRKEILQALGAFKSVSNYDGKPNQFEVRFENGVIFQSYDSIIVIQLEVVEQASLSQHSFKTYFGNDWNYSRTTSKYRNKFLSKDTEWCKQQVKIGSIQVLDI